MPETYFPTEYDESIKWNKKKSIAHNKIDGT